jgi:uncharacterized protein YaiE (UPF0345 family)
MYFGGNVSSRTIIFADGSRKTLGVMVPGEYEFNTGDKEIMEIYSGDLSVKLPHAEWFDISGGQTFEVPANSKFSVRVRSLTDYCCSFIA